jgi:hypothetical protein
LAALDMRLASAAGCGDSGMRSVQMAFPVRGLAVFAVVIAGVGLFTATQLSTTPGTIAPGDGGSIAVARPVVPSYMARMPAEGTAPAKIATVAPPRPVTPRAPVLPPLPVVEPVALEVAAVPTFTHKVVASGANVRSGPKKTYPQVFTLPQGSLVNVGENISGWVKVTDQSGREGWMYGALLEEQATATVATAPAAAESSVVTLPALALE